MEIILLIAGPTLVVSPEGHHEGLTDVESSIQWFVTTATGLGTAPSVMLELQF